MAPSSTLSRFATILAIAAALLAPALTSAGPRLVRVPFVGCNSDGQLGPMPAPRAPGCLPRLPAATAARLAYYVSRDLRVLAPRGWRCFGLYGSDGSILYVSPASHASDPFGASFSGPVVQLSLSVGDTSGRFEAARIAARLFPDRARFVQSVIAKGIAPKSAFPQGPFPEDRVQRLAQDVVAFETPAKLQGMGTMSRLTPSSDSIRGLAIMDRANDATLLQVRLSAALRGLDHAVLEEARRDYKPRP